MKKISIKNSSVVFVIWIVISGLISVFATFKLKETNLITDSRIFLVFFMILILPMMNFLFPSLCQEERNTAIKKATEYFKKEKYAEALSEVESILEVNFNDQDAIKLKEEIIKNYKNT